MNLDALFFAFLDFFFIGGHFLKTATIDDEGLFGSRPQGGTHRIHRHIPTADHGHTIAQIYLPAKIHLSKEIHPRVNPLKAFSLDAQCLALMRSNGKKNGLIPLFPQLLYREILPDLHTGPDLHSHVFDHLDLRLENIPWKAIFGDTQSEHTTRHRKLLIDRCLVALYCKIIGA